MNEVMQLMERFDSSKATKLQIKTGDMELVLESAAVQVVASPVQVAVPEPESATIVATTASKQLSADAGSLKAASKMADDMTGTPVKAPLIGTFYCAPSPDEKPFVEVGQSVKQGDIVGIIEAMKLMNEITAPADGVVKTIRAQNGNMVEYGEVLMVLE